LGYPRRREERREGESGETGRREGEADEAAERVSEGDGREQTDHHAASTDVTTSMNIATSMTVDAAMTKNDN
jgi:hypothetical protein